jgi:hypothetical protein
MVFRYLRLSPDGDYDAQSDRRGQRHRSGHALSPASDGASPYQRASLPRLLFAAKNRSKLLLTILHRIVNALPKHSFLEHC